MIADVRRLIASVEALSGERAKAVYVAQDVYRRLAEEGKKACLLLGKPPAFHEMRIDGIPVYETKWLKAGTAYCSPAFIDETRMEEDARAIGLA